MRTDTSQRLVDTAFGLFDRHGFHAIGLDRILDEVGVSKQTFYNHFESKDDLILAVLRQRSAWEFETFGRMLKEIAGDDARAALLGIFDVLDAWFRRDEFRRCIFISAAIEFPLPHDPVHQEAARHWQRIRDALRQMAEAAGAFHPEQLAGQLMVLLDGAHVARHVCGDGRGAQLAKSCAEALLDRHLPPARHPSPRRVTRRQPALAGGVGD